MTMRIEQDRNENVVHGSYLVHSEQRNASGQAPVPQASASARPSSPARRRSARDGEPRRLASLLSVSLDQQAVMMPDRHRQAEQRLEQAVDVAGGEQVAPARHQRDRRRRHRRAWRQGDSWPGSSLRTSTTSPNFRDRPAAARQLVESIPAARSAPMPLPCRAARPRHSGRRRDPCRCRDRSGRRGRSRSPRRDLGAGAAAGIEQAHRLQRGGGRHCIAGEARGLEHGSSPQSRPSQRGRRANSARTVRPAARAVDILDPQQEFAAPRPRKVMRDHGGIGMAEVQRPLGLGAKRVRIIAHLFLWIAPGKRLCKS
jgi:hypothetical protein